MPGKQDVINQDIDRLKDRVSKGNWIQSQNSHTTTKTTTTRTTALKTEQRAPLQEVVINSQEPQETELLQSNTSIASKELHESAKNPGFMKTAGYFMCPGCDPEGILVGSNSRCQCSHAHQKGSFQSIKLGQLVAPVIINERVEEREINEHVMAAGATMGSTVETERATPIQETIEETIITNIVQPVQQSTLMNQQSASQGVGIGQQASQVVGFGQQTSQGVGIGQQTSQGVDIRQQTYQGVGIGQQAGIGQQTSQGVGIGQQTSQVIDERVLEQHIVDEHVVDGARIVSQELHPEQAQVYEERLGSTVETEIIKKVTTPIQRTVVTPVEQKLMVPVEKTIVTNIAQKVITPVEKTVMTQVSRKVIEYVQQNVIEYETRTITEPVQKTITEPVERIIYEDVPQTVVENVTSTVITPFTQKVIVPVEQTIVKNVTQTTMVPVTQTFVSHEGGLQQTQSSQSQYIQQSNQFSSQPIVGAGSSQLNGGSQVNGQKRKHHFFSRKLGRK